MSNETFDLFLNNVYSLGIRISSLNVNKSEISSKFLCNTKIKDWKYRETHPKLSSLNEF